MPFMVTLVPVSKDRAGDSAGGNLPSAFRSGSSRPAEAVLHIPCCRLRQQPLSMG